MKSWLTPVMLMALLAEPAPRFGRAPAAPWVQTSTGAKGRRGIPNQRFMRFSALRAMPPIYGHPSRSAKSAEMAAKREGRS